MHIYLYFCRKSKEQIRKREINFPTTFKQFCDENRFDVRYPQFFR
jgi:hypothetical protein